MFTKTGYDIHDTDKQTRANNEQNRLSTDRHIRRQADRMMITHACILTKIIAESAVTFSLLLQVYLD